MPVPIDTHFDFEGLDLSHIPEGDYRRAYLAITPPELRAQVLEILIQLGRFDPKDPLIKFAFLMKFDAVFMGGIPQRIVDAHATGADHLRALLREIETSREMVSADLRQLSSAITTATNDLLPAAQQTSRYAETLRDGLIDAAAKTQDATRTLFGAADALHPKLLALIDEVSGYFLGGTEARLESQAEDIAVRITTDSQRITTEALTQAHLTLTKEAIDATHRATAELKQATAEARATIPHLSRISAWRHAFAIFLACFAFWAAAFLGAYFHLKDKSEAELAEALQINPLNTNISKCLAAAKMRLDVLYKEDANNKIVPGEYCLLVIGSNIDSAHNVNGVAYIFFKSRYPGFVELIRQLHPSPNLPNR